MFTITSRIRVLVAIGAVGGTLGCAAVASAIPVATKPGATTSVTLKPIVVNQPVTPYQHVGSVSGAGSAGIPGYDDAKCASLAQDNNTAVSYGDQAAASGDSEAEVSYYNQAANIYQQLSDNCLVID
jgi:hypothetical protein